MADNVESLLLEQFRRLNARMDKKDLEDFERGMRLSAIDEHLAGIMTSIAGINQRFDRLDERVGRIERRLELRDAD